MAIAVQDEALRNRGGFFSDYFVASLQSEKALRGLLGEDTRAPAYGRLRTLYRRQYQRLGVDSKEGQTRRDWLLPLFEQLGFHDPVHGRPLAEAEPVEVEGVSMRSSHAYTPEGAEAPACLIDLLAWGQGLDEALPERGKRWTPHRRMLALLDASGVHWGLLANGEAIRLLRREDEGAGQQYLEVAFEPLLIDGDDTAFAVFWALFRAQAFAGEGAEGCLLDRVQALSEQRGTKVSTELGESVVDALSALMRGLLEREQNWREERLGSYLTRQGDGPARAAADLSAEGLQDVYRQGLVFLFRMLFVLYAESRGVLPVDVPAYAEQYSIERLRERLLQPGSDWQAGEQRVWTALQAMTRVMREGLPAAEFHVPAFNGRLFAADEAPLLESCAIGDDVMQQVVLALTMTRPKKGKLAAQGLDRISYRELGVDQLGAVYEGLLDYEPRVAQESMAVVYEKKARLVKPLRELEAVTEDAGRYELGQFYLDPSGGARKGSGTYYTPREFTSVLVEQALGPQVEGKTSEEILELKVLDPAMGSGAFLIAACNYLAERYVEARDLTPGPFPRDLSLTLPYEGRERTGQRDGATEDFEEDRDEPALDREARLARARRLVAERCLYGVDKNPMAVQLARVSLWLTTMAEDRPLTFLDHHLRCGDSLVGTGFAELDEPVPDACLDTEARRRNKKFALNFRGLTDTVDLRTLIETLLRHREELAGEDDSPADVQRKDQLLQEDLRDPAYQRAKDCLDLRSALWFWPGEGGAPLDTTRFRDAVNALAGLPTTLTEAEAEALRRTVREIGAEKRFFHWELEFPELFWAPDGRRLSATETGFDAVLGNPPFGNAVENLTSRQHRESMYYAAAYSSIASGAYDRANLFFGRALELLTHGGALGLIGPRAMASSKAGEHLRHYMSSIAPPRMLWCPDDPHAFGAASVFVCLVGAVRGSQPDVLRVSTSRPGGAVKFRATRVLSTDSGRTWWEFVNDAPPQYGLGGGGQMSLGEVARISAGCATGTAYELAPLVEDTANGAGPKLITTGAIDRYRSRWGQMKVRYLKRDYAYPRWPSGPTLASVERARDRQKEPKILVAGLSKVIEAFADEEGDYAGVVSTHVVVPLSSSERTRYALLAVMNSSVFSHLYLARFGAKQMSGENCTIGKPELLSTQIPADLAGDRAPGSDGLAVNPGWSARLGLADLRRDTLWENVIELARAVTGSPDYSVLAEADTRLHALVSALYGLAPEEHDRIFGWWVKRITVSNGQE